MALTIPSDPFRTAAAVSDRSGAASSALLGWLVVVVLTATLTAVSTYQSLRRYDELRTGWSWDLAYYNQWFWALTRGDGQVSVRPLAYSQEGPSIWKMNYLAPIRFAIAPIYWLFPDPRTLIVVQNVMFWWVMPAAYGLVRSESARPVVAVSAVLLVPLAPLLWPLVWNDFRELQLAAAFILWAIQGVRGRSVRLAAWGIVGTLACRQEYALIVATLGALPPRRAEPLDVALRWRRAMVLIGTGWALFGFFGYLRFMVGRGSPDSFIDWFFLQPRASAWETLQTSVATLVLGMGGWALLMCLAPRVAILSLPWIWSLCNGRWAIRYLSTPEWHHVRYAMPMTVMVLAAGLIGYARLAAWLVPRPAGRAALALAWLAIAAMSAASLRDLCRRMDEVPQTFARQEAREIRSWAHQVGPDDAVLAAYEVSAPLSSRRSLYSYVLDPNHPKGFPRLGPEFRWIFVQNDYLFLKPLLEQGFDVVHRGPFLTIARRRATNPAE